MTDTGDTYNIGRSLRGMPQPTRGRRNVRKLVGGFDREKDDFYPTPAPLTRALLALEPFDGAVWECACRRRRDGEHPAPSATLSTRPTLWRAPPLPGGIDFLMETATLDQGAPNVVTNPRRSSCGSSSPTTRSTSAPTRWCCSAACSTSRARPPRR
jgi:hypothetical protein